MKYAIIDHDRQWLDLFQRTVRQYDLDSDIYTYKDGDEFLGTHKDIGKLNLVVTGISRVNAGETIRKIRENGKRRNGKPRTKVCVFTAYDRLPADAGIDSQYVDKIIFKKDYFELKEYIFKGIGIFNKFKYLLHTKLYSRC
jgi:hypothetical protein